VQDFRPHLRPPPQRSESVEGARDLLRRGQLLNALRLARRVGVEPTALEPDLSSCARRMFVGRRCGELLVAIATYGVQLPYDARELVHKAQSYGDHHTVVKNIVRLGLQVELRQEMEASIEAIGKRAPAEATSWRAKLAGPR